MRTWRILPGGHIEAMRGLRPTVAASRDGGFIWVELDHPDRADFADIEGDLGLHALAVEDAVSARDRPKLDIYDGTRFVTSSRAFGPVAPHPPEVV